MFKPSDDKRAHELVHGDVLLFDNEYYIVESATRTSPALTEVVLVSTNPLWTKRRETLQSDLRVMLYTWQ